jgi:hypothetical protein
MPSRDRYTVLLVPLIAILFQLRCCLTDFVSPYPANDCTGGIAMGAVTCPSQPGCCSGGAQCCAGGCCPMLSYCVNVGLSDEGCCPFDDPTNCGVEQPTSTVDDCSWPKPSKLCSTADESWYCPPDDTCGTYDGSCFAIFGSSCTPGSSDDISEATVVPSSSPSASASASGSDAAGVSNRPTPNDAPQVASSRAAFLALLAPILIMV